MGGGKERKATQQRQEALSQQQEQLGKFFMDQSKEALAQRQKLQAPVIDYYTQLASGDPSKVMAASAVPLGNLAKMTQQAKANIMEMAPGAARTAALGQLNREAGGQQATTLNQAYLSAFPALQGLAAESGSTGLQEAGAGYRGTEGAAASNQQIMQAQQQQKASQLGLIGSLAGAAGSIAGGFLGGKGGGGGIGKPTDLSRLPVSTAINPVLSYYQQNPITMPSYGTFNYQNPLNYQTPQLPTTASSYFSYGK